MQRTYNKFRRICAFIVGAVFFVSGIIKLMDPLGAGLVVDEYFKFLHIGFLSFSSKTVAEFLALLETLLGIALMTGLWRKIVAIITMCFLALFTILTLFLFIFNPEMDCGCFGEAVHLTHFQSFIKNIILCALAAVAFFPLGKLGRPKKRKYVSFGIVTAATVLFAIYSLLYIPLVDFTDFRATTRLEAGVNNAPDVFKAAFVYEKDGNEQYFSLDNLPDSTWTYVRTETTQVENSGEHVAQLSFSDQNGDYQDYMAVMGDVLVFSIYNPNTLSAKKWQKVINGVSEAENAGYTPLVLVASDFNSFEGILTEKLPESSRLLMLHSYMADRKTLLTLNRSNGGATHFSGGTLVRKWAFRNLPSADKLLKNKSPEDALVETSSTKHLLYQSFYIFTFAVVLFI